MTRKEALEYFYDWKYNLDRMTYGDIASQEAQAELSEALTIAIEALQQEPKCTKKSYS